MPSKQPKLLTPPPGHNNLQQPRQIPEEHPIHLDLFPTRPAGVITTSCLAAPRSRQPTSPRPFAQLDLLPRRGLLLGNRIMHALGQRSEESQIHCARDARAVAQVYVRQAGEELAKRTLWGEESEFGLCGHFVVIGNIAS